MYLYNNTVALPSVSERVQLYDTVNHKKQYDLNKDVYHNSRINDDSEIDEYYECEPNYIDYIKNIAQPFSFINLFSYLFG